MRRRGAAPWPAAVAGSLLLGLSFFVLQRWLERGRLSDVGVYHHYAGLIRAGAVPYRDFPVEYPPAALGAFLVPSYLPWSYATSFAVLMGLCGAGCVAAAAAVLHGVGARAGRAWAALLLIGVSPLALGSLFDTRFDLWPALLALVGLAFVLSGRALPAGALAGLGFAAKLWPIVLAPLGLAYLWRKRGGGAALAAAAACLVAAGACFFPFVALSPGGVRHSLTAQLDRPLQVESLGSALLLTVQHLGGPTYPTVTSHGSQGLAGSVPDAVGAATSALELAAVLGLWLGFARVRRPTGEGLVLASAATLAAVVALGKVFSPQFLIWLVPFVPLARGRRGAAASALLLLALGLTQTWFPGEYWSLALGHAGPYWRYLLLRDLAVLALAVVLAWPRGLQHDLLGEQRSRLEALQAIRR